MKGKPFKVSNYFRMRQDFRDLRQLNHQEGKSKFISGVKAMYLGFLPWTIFESLRELNDWWAF
jgi:hypothetical protein